MTQDTARCETRVFLPAVAPFDFGASLRFIRGFPAMAGEQGTEGDVLSRAVREDGALAAVRLSAAADGVGLDCEIRSQGPLTEQAVSAIGDRLTFQFGLDEDLAEFYALARSDPSFARLVGRLHGYHQVKFPSPLEMLCWAILCQRVPMPVARKMKQALVTEAGNQVSDVGEVLWAFPDQAQLQALSEERLHEVIGNSRKAGYLYRAVRQWAEIDEEFLRTGDYDAVREWLLGMAGVGPWSASFVLIRGLGRTEHMAPDKEALRAASRVYGHPVGEAEFTELADRYGKWQGYWGHYMRVAG